MNIRPSLHNVLVILGVVILGRLAFILASRTGLARLPVAGQVIALGAA